MSRNQPVPPQQRGTFAFPDLPNTYYTVGRQEAIEEIRRIRSTTHTIAVDTESYGLGLNALDLKCVQMGTGTRVAVLDPRDPAQADEIRSTIRHAREISMHYSAFDVPTLVHNKLMRLDDIGKVVDTLIYARLAEPDERTSKSLLNCGHRYLGTDPTDALVVAFKEARMSKAKGFEVYDLDRPLYVMGAAIDAIITARLLPRVREAALATLTTGHPFSRFGVTGQEALDLRDREQRINRIFLKRSARGLRVDIDYLQEYKDANARTAVEIETCLTDLGIKPGHGGSLTTWLDLNGHLPHDYPRTPKTGAPSAQARHLEDLSHPVAQQFVTLKRMQKIEKDYLAKVVEMASVDGRIHPQTNILGATTGRMSMNHPPLHQFNGPARGIVISEEGESLTSIDWSQIEPVVAANVAKETRVLRDYENPEGKADMYETVAAMARVSRKEAKVMLLAQMYGQGIARLAGSMGITLDEAYEIRNAIFRSMPKVQNMIAKLKAISNTYGKIFTLSGRIVPVPTINDAVAAYKGVNYFVQGSAYDVLADTICRIEDAGLAGSIYLAMHDELVVESSAAHDVQRIMQTPPERLCLMAGRRPTLRTDALELGNRWAEA
jgi:DNA polymerase I